MSYSQLAKSRSIQSRWKRLFVIFASLFFFYIILDYSLDIKMILVNYFMSPFILLVLLFLFFKKKSLQSEPNIKNITVFSYKKLIIDLFSVVIFITMMVLSIALIPGLFLSGTLALTDSQNVELAEIVSHYHTRLWFMTPWPVIMIYVGFLGGLAQNYGIYDIKTFVHKIYKSEFEHDTGHNLLMALHNAPYTFTIGLITVIGIYAAYFAITEYLGLTALQGVNYYSLSFCFISIILVSRKKIKDILRSYDYHLWSILKLLLIVSGILILWLLIPTIIFNIANPNGLITLKGEYNFYNYDIKLQYLFLIWVLWWFCMPMIGYFCYQKLQSYHYKISMLLAFLAILFTYSVFNLSVVNEYLFSKTLFLLNFKAFKLPMLIIIISSFLYYAFNKQYDNDLLTLDLISKKDSTQKNRPASRSYYYLFLMFVSILTIVVLENIFMLYKLLSFFSIVNLILLFYFILGLRKLKNHQGGVIQTNDIKI
jgi:hypothetical protein